MRRPIAPLFAAALMALGLAASACAPIPPPDVLARLDEVRETPVSKEAAKDAPGAFAQAERLRDLANRAFEEGDFAAAQLTGERAVVAYQKAAAIARVARADRQRVAAQADVDRSERELTELDAEHQRVEASMKALAARLAMLEALSEVQPSGDAKGKREVARREAVRTLGLQARLMCAAGEMLAQSHRAADRAPLLQATKTLTELELLVSKEGAAPIDHAMRARAECLRALATIRRGLAAAGSSDALLDELSKAGHGKSRRDERGVVLTLRNVFDGDALAAEARVAVDSLAAIAKRHPDVPVMVVLHQVAEPSSAERTRLDAQARVLSAALRDAGAPLVGEPQLAGAAAPLVAPDSKHKAHNERVDIVFIASTT